MSSRNLSGGKGWPICEDDNLIAIYEPMSTKCGNLDISQLYIPLRSVTGMALPYLHEREGKGIKGLLKRIPLFPNTNPDNENQNYISLVEILEEDDNIYNYSLWKYRCKTYAQF
jgi:hypothetical protein